MEENGYRGTGAPRKTNYGELGSYGKTGRGELESEGKERAKVKWNIDNKY